jgi:hypothetical protein
MKQNRAVLNGRVLSAIVLSVLMIVAGARAIVLPPEAAQGVSAASPLADGMTTATSANPSLASLDAYQQPSVWNHWGLNE